MYHPAKVKMKLDTTDRGLLNLLQARFPLKKNPFAVLGEVLGIGENETLRRVKNLKSRGIVRSLGGVFDSSKLGYRSTLVTMHVPYARLKKAVAVINEHPGVSHNYARGHYYNLWFTLTAAPDQNLEAELNDLVVRTGVSETLSLPSVRVFKIGVYFDMFHKGISSARPGLTRQLRACRASGVVPSAVSKKRLSNADKAVLRELCRDLPLKKEPFKAMAGRLNISVGKMLEKARFFKGRGIMRRYGASIRHRSTGFIANAMACWNVPLDMMENAGKKTAAYAQVSHCYQRRISPLAHQTSSGPVKERIAPGGPLSRSSRDQRSPRRGAPSGWNYNFFAMIHERTRRKCKRVASQICKDIGISACILLYSSKEYKMKRIEYFPRS